MTFFRKTIMFTGLLLIASISAQSAMAVSFKDDGARIWVARTERFIAASQGEAAGGGNFFEQGKAACDGITGELFKIGGVVPIWAAESHRSFCRGMDGFGSRRSFRKACGDIKSTIGYLENARPEKAPQEVVTAAEKFRISLETFMQAAKAEHVC
jgi:hypothetical protein